MFIVAISLVIGSGIFHAIWSMLTKKSMNKQFYLFLISIPSTAVFLPSMISELIRKGIILEGLFLLLLSLIIEGLYAFLLSRSLSIGDLSRVYPMMRGTSIFLIPVCGVIFLNENLTLWGWIAIVLTIGVGLCTTGYFVVDKINLHSYT